MRRTTGGQMAEKTYTEIVQKGMVSMMMQTEPIMGGSSPSKENVRNACRTVEVKMQPRPLGSSLLKEDVRNACRALEPIWVLPGKYRIHNITFAGMISEDGREFYLELYGMVYGHLFLAREIMHKNVDEPKGYIKFRVNADRLINYGDAVIKIETETDEKTYFSQEITSRCINSVFLEISLFGFRYENHCVPVYDCDHIRYTDTIWEIIEKSGFDYLLYAEFGAVAFPADCKGFGEDEKRRWAEYLICMMERNVEERHEYLGDMKCSTEEETSSKPLPIADKADDESYRQRKREKHEKRQRIREKARAKRKPKNH